MLNINNCHCWISTAVIAEYQQLSLLNINNFNNWRSTTETININNWNNWRSTTETININNWNNWRSTTETIEYQQLKQLNINNWNNIFKQIVNKLLLLCICCLCCLCCLFVVQCCLWFVVQCCLWFVVQCCLSIVYVVYALFIVVYILSMYYPLLSTTIRQSTYQEKVKRKIFYKHCKHLLITYQKAIKTQRKTLWNYNLKALVLPPETHGFTP